MMISEINESFVWVWLPNESEPCVAGKLIRANNHHIFYYGQSYLKRSNAIALAPDLPLIDGHAFESRHHLHLIFRDTLPDAWGQRILLHRYQQADLTPFQMLHLSSSDRIGALHFQDTAKQYESRFENHNTLQQMLQAVELIEAGQAIPEVLHFAIIHGTSIGGARPKAIIDDDKHKWIAKFSSSTDIYPIVQAEYAAMCLAHKLSLNVPNVELQTVNNKFVLLVERFDRVFKQDAWNRMFMVSGMTLLGLDDLEGRYASYLDLADQIRRQAKQSKKDLHELFRRMVFNIIIGNTDDHGKNHAFFWDGENYALTPAYDLCPYLRAGGEATQAMTVGKQGSLSTLNNALSECEFFDLTKTQAQIIIDDLLAGTKKHWENVCLQAKLTEFQAKQLLDSAILNPYIFT